MKAVDHDLIKQRAYDIWEQSGCPHGLDKEHWEQAERELLDAAPAIKAKVTANSTTESTLGSVAEDARAAARGNLEQEAVAKPPPGLPPSRSEGAGVR